MLQIKLDIWIEDSYSKVKLPSDERFAETIQIFAENEKNCIKLYELSKKFMNTFDEINFLLKNMEKE